MFFRSLRGLPVAILAALPLLAAATPERAATLRADPTQPGAPVPPLQHRSALDHYQRLSDEPRRDWRAANAEAARIGGWRAYLREAHAPEPAASAASAAGDAPVRTPAGHHSGGRP